jgi:UDP-3-O-[3-hydroxymyristoyl] glucosamine N-acyltransferase
VGCLIWAQAGLSGHLTIGDRGQVGPQCGLTKSVPPGDYFIGTPGGTKREFAAQILAPRQIEKLKERIDKLEAKIDVVG